jgi:8-oxo-dGTP diphosphatase
VRGDGDGWVTCERGHRHWGRFGAAGLLVRDGAEPGRRVVLQHRAGWSHEGGTWGLPGGARDSGESPVQAALREAAEEAGVQPDEVRPAGLLHDEHGGWSYTTVVAEPSRPLRPRPTGGESEDVRWVHVEEVDRLPLHPGFASTWPRLRQAPRALVLVVDAANVVGARGRAEQWWRDRAGATRRLRDQLVPLAMSGIAPVELPAAGAAPAAAADLDVLFPRVVLVVEGAASTVAAEVVPGIDVVPARGSGDDRIVAVARDERASARVLAVTADRGLAARLAALGVPRVGPSWLLSRIGGGSGR